MHKTTSVLLLLVAAVLAFPQNKDLDRTIDEIFGGPLATNTNDNTDKNTKDADRIIDEIFGGPLATNTNDNTDKNTKDVDRTIDEIFVGPQATNTNDNTDKPTIDKTEKNTPFRGTGKPCLIKNVAGVCTPYYLCKNDIISKDEIILDLANEEDQYYCASYLDVCCTRENIIDKVDIEEQ